MSMYRKPSEMLPVTGFFFTCFGRDRFCPRTLRSWPLDPVRRGHVARLLEGQKDFCLPEVGENKI